MKKFTILIGLFLATVITGSAFAWTTTEEFDDFDGTTLKTSMVLDDYSSFLSISSLVVRTKSKVGEWPTDIFIIPGDWYICETKKNYVEGVKYKFDDGKIYTVDMVLSTDRQALFFPNVFSHYKIPQKKIDFVNGLNNAKVLAVRYHDSCGTQFKMKFNISGSRPHINWQIKE